MYRAAADGLVLLHLGFVLYVVAGGLLALRYRRAPWLHLPAAIWGAAIEIGGGVCPLTPLENRLRAAGGGGGYGGGFVEHYVLPLVYPAGLTRSTQIVLGSIVLLANLLVYGAVWRVRLRRSAEAGMIAGAPGRTGPSRRRRR
jgi:hypothetical protein